MKSITYLLKVKGVTGVEKHVLHLCQGLRDEFVLSVIVLEKPDHPQDVYCDELRRIGVKVFRLPLQKTFSWRTLLAVEKILRQQHTEILHTHLLVADLIGCFMKFFKSQLIWVSTIHNVYSFQSMRKSVLAMYRILLRRADLVVFISRYMQDFLQQVLSLKNTSIIYHGVKSPERELGTAMVESHSTKSILFVGRLIDLKGCDDLLKAFALLQPQSNHYQLIVVGAGPESDRLKQLAQDLKIESSVDFAGYQSDVMPFFEKTDLFVLPSHSEGLALSLIEAMSYGKAIVANDITNIAECITHEESGLLVKDRDIYGLSLSLKRLLQDPKMSRRLGAAARLAFEKTFTQEKMIEAYRILYRMF